MIRSTVAPLAMVIALLLGASVHHPTRAQDDQAGYCADQAAIEMLQHINAYREENGLEPLELSQPLGNAAEFKARDMSERDYLAHTSPDGQGLQELMNQVGYTFNTTFGENIAAGQMDAEATFEQWENSPEHREIMLGEGFTAVGIGRAHNPEAKYDWYWAAEFGGVVGAPARACDGATPMATPDTVSG